MSRAFFCDLLVRPSYFYRPIKEISGTFYVRSILISEAMSWDRHLEKNGLRPSKLWYAARETFVKPRKKPTMTITPAAKSEVSPVSTRGRSKGAGGKLMALGKRAGKKNGKMFACGDDDDYLHRGDPNRSIYVRGLGYNARYNLDDD